MTRLGTWKAFRGESIADVFRKLESACYVPPSTIETVEHQGGFMPPWMRPAGIPVDWKLEVGAIVRRNGGLT